MLNLQESDQQWDEELKKTTTYNGSSVKSGACAGTSYMLISWL